MDQLDRRRRMMALAQRALDYYDDTGLCVFCDADDCASPPLPHNEDCDVGRLLGATVTKERIAEKRRQRQAVENLFRGW